MLKHRFSRHFLCGLAFAVTAVTFVGCGGGGGGGGVARLELLNAQAETGPLLPFDAIHLNERIILNFSAPIDPASVDQDSVQIRTRISGFAVPADGDYLVSGSSIVFVPRIPSRQDLSDSGFLASTDYRVFLPGFPDQRAVRSLGGGALPVPFSVEFRTRGDQPFLLDSSPGRPFVTVVAVDLDRDGEFAADGDPATPDAEEFPSFQSVPFLTEAPVGLARAPLAIGLFLDQPVLPETLFLDNDQDGNNDAIELIDRNTGRVVPVRFRLDQRFVPEDGSTRVLVRIIPKTVLPASGFIEISLRPSILDFGTPPQPVLPLLTALTTLAGPAVFDDALVESFESPENRSSETTADWGGVTIGSLAPTSGIGGSGVDGVLRVEPMTSVILDTSERDGVFQFRKVTVEAGGTLVVQGPNPLQLLCTGDVEIFGGINASGTFGANGENSATAGITVAQGGAGGPGGFFGGNGNDPAGTGPRFGKNGAGPSEENAGQGGGRALALAGGGGGGGHSLVGESDFGAQSGDGGVPYGDPEISVLLGGSGGGAGGNGTMGGDADRPGGGGGGGGGAVSIRCAGIFRFGVAGAGSLFNCDGGNGGVGSNPSSGGPSARAGGGGGGGAGGAVKIQAIQIDDLTAGTITADGGIGGAGGSGAGARPGGAGAPGYIRIEAFDTNRDGIANEFLAMNVINPSPSVGILDESLLRVSVAQSLFTDTGTDNASFSFDGTDPLTGLYLRGVPIDDLILSDPLPAGMTLTILFEGAQEDVNNPGSPDLSTSTGFVTDVSQLNNFRFIRFRLEFDLGEGGQPTDAPRIEQINIPFNFSIGA